VEIKGSREERGLEERRGRWAVGDKRGKRGRQGKAERACQAPGYERNEFTASGSLAKKSGKIRETPGWKSHR